MPRKKITDKVDKVLDVRGLLCPMPTVMTSKTLKEMKKGKSLKVISNDITTRDSIPSLCSEEGYSILDSEEKNGLISFVIRT